MSTPRQVTLARLAELGLRPDKELGQHFLVDDNLLGVIERLAALEPDDVALEIGAGVGTLTAHLAGLCAHVHAVEIDRRLEEALTRTLEGSSNVTVHWGDAMRLALVAFEPPRDGLRRQPALPRGGAAPTRLDRRPPRACERWCVLVQREIAERLTAGPGDALYGGPSVLCALALEPSGRHAVSRSVFVPVPNVDSTLVAFARRARVGGLAGDWPQIVATVRAAFAYRRKTIANALALAGWRDDRAPWTQPARSPASIRPRAPRRCPPRPSRGWREPAPDVIAGVKINLSLRVGPPRGDGYHELATVLAALSAGDDLELEPAAVTRVEAPGLTGGDALVTRALDLLAARAGHAAGLARAHRQARAGRRRARRRQRRCRRRAAAGERDAARAARRRDLLALAAQVGSDVPFFASGLVGARAGPRRAARAVPARAQPAGSSLAWPGVGSRTADVYARYRPSAGACERVAALAPSPSRPLTPSCWRPSSRTTLGLPAEQLCPPAAALRGQLLARVRWPRP